MTTATEIGAWFDRGLKQGASHMIVMVDTFDYEDYPCFAKDVDEAREKIANPGEMQRVMEVYNLSMDKDTQLNAPRVHNL